MWTATMKTMTGGQSRATQKARLCRILPGVPTSETPPHPAAICRPLGTLQGSSTQQQSRRGQSSPLYPGGGAPHDGSPRIPLCRILPGVAVPPGPPHPPRRPAVHAKHKMAVFRRTSGMGRSNLHHTNLLWECNFHDGFEGFRTVCQFKIHSCSPKVTCFFSDSE